MVNNITVFNIREYLSNSDDILLGENALKDILSEFSCKKNPDVEKFLKEQAIDFTKKNQSVTYLVISNDDLSLLGYFTLVIKPITIYDKRLSKTIIRKISRVSELNESDGTFYLSAYLIAQLGKNFTNGLNDKITGEQLLQSALETIKELQFRVGGMVVFLESTPENKLIQFYQNQNNFMLFNSKKTKVNSSDTSTLIQLLKII